LEPELKTKTLDVWSQSRSFEFSVPAPQSCFGLLSCFVVYDTKNAFAKRNLLYFSRFSVSFTIFSKFKPLPSANFGFNAHNRQCIQALLVD